MEVSAEKTCVMVFGKAAKAASAAAAARGATWSCGGVQLERVDTYTYLGVRISAATGINAAPQGTRRTMFGSWASLCRQFGTLHHGTSLALQLRLFQQAIPQAGSYCSAVWGVRYMVGQAMKARRDVARCYVQLLRRLLRVHGGVAASVVLREVGAKPLDSLWLRSALRFWNTLAEAPVGSLHRDVALSDWEEAVVRNVRNWAWSVWSSVRDLGYVLPIDRHRMPCIDIDAVMALHDAREEACWANVHDCPQTCPPEGASLTKYARWFAAPVGVSRSPFIDLSLGLSRVRTVIRFRLGCHALPVVVLRHARPRVPRADRLCLRCDMRALGDEQHLLLECPSVQGVRELYPHLFPIGCTMREFIRHEDIYAVARCIVALLEAYG